MRLHPLGYPAEIESGCRPVLSAACESWRAWPRLFDAPPVQVIVEVQSGSAPPPDLPRFEASPERLRFTADEGNFAHFDLEARQGLLRVTDGLLHEAARFRHHFLEALVLTALDCVFFTPLHAACVARKGAGVLLCGDSGAGKSSLAYACARRGWTFVSDDAVHLAPGPERTGVGGSNIIHLREPSRALFPELHALDAGHAPNGKRAIEIDAAAHGFRTARHATASHCLFLERRPGPAAVRPYSAPAAIDYFLKYLSPRDTTAAERHLREFLSPAPLLLEYERVEDAIDVLETLA